MSMRVAVADGKGSAAARMPQLIDIDVTPFAADGEPLSADRRRTEKRRLMLDAGNHPTGLGKIDRAFTCGQCIHCVSNSKGNRTWWKCDRKFITNGAGTDIRLSWPSCPKFEAR